MRINARSSCRRKMVRVLLALALAVPPVQLCLAQAGNVAPLVTPPVPKVTPPPTPEVLPPVLPAAPFPQTVPPGPPVRIDDVRVQGVTVYDAATVRAQFAGLIGQTVAR